MPRSLLQLLALSHGSESSPRDAEIPAPGMQKYPPRDGDQREAVTQRRGSACRQVLLVPSSCKVYFNQQTPSH